ncbi:MAG: hypothetical protein DMD62_07265 [Gemmatimonadetes bacterium]|nr:MAG: hypothetical protein DMD62_07265 [Gemmatimonadota bacterium]
MKQVSLVVAVAVVGLAACRTDSSVQPNQPAMNTLISDGAHLDALGNGNKDFFFLPPLVPSPVNTPFFDVGKFNAKLAPTVEICELNATDLVSLATANCKSGTVRVLGPVNMTLDASNEQYQLNWDTKASLLNAASFYRILVRGAAKGTVLGTLDIDPVLGGVKNAKTGDVYVFQDGRTLPIKVRIEQGAFGSGNSSDRVEQVVPAVLPPTGLDVTTNTGSAGAHFPNGWLPPGVTQVVVIIERIPVNDGGSATSCLQSGLEELEGCYRFRTDPDLHTLGPDGTDLPFALPVTAGVCFQFPADIGHDNQHPFQLHKREEVAGVLLGSAVPLDEVPAPFLHCENFGATPPSIGAAFRSGRIGDVAKAGLYAVAHAIGRVLQPEALHAVDFGAGGNTSGFSRFGYARRAAMTVTAGDGASAAAGSTIDAAVQVRTTHHETSFPVVGQSVTFTVTGGGGTVSTATCEEGPTCPANTNSSGVADVTWRLGVGVNTIQVTTGYVTNSPQMITAVGTASALAAYEVSTTDAIPVPATVGFARSTAQCSAGKVVFGGGTQVISEGTADFNTRMQESAPGTVGINNETSVWLASIDNEDGAAHNVRIFATCGTAPFGYEVVTKDVAIAAGGFARDAVQCPAGKVVLGGGAQVTGEGTTDFDTRLQESAPGTVGVNNETSVWLVSARNQDAAAHTMRLFAVCTYMLSGYEVVSGASTPLGANGGFNRNAVPCPAGKVVLGGGAQVVGEGSADFNTRLQESAPGTVGLSNETGVWLSAVKNLDEVAHNVRFLAVCGTAS